MPTRAERPRFPCKTFQNRCRGLAGRSRFSRNQEGNHERYHQGIDEFHVFLCYTKISEYLSTTNVNVTQMVNGFPSQIKNMDSLTESRYGLDQIMWTGKHINDQLPVVGGFNAFRKFARNFWGDFPQFLGVQSKKWFKRNQLSNPKMDLKRLEWLGTKGEEL